MQKKTPEKTTPPISTTEIPGRYTQLKARETTPPNSFEKVSKSSTEVTGIQGYPARSEQMQAKVAKRRLERQAQQALLNSIRQYFQADAQPSNDADSHSNPAQKLPEGQKILLPSQELINSSKINTTGGTLIENTITESTITALEAETTNEDEIVWAPKRNNSL